MFAILWIVSNLHASNLFDQNTSFFPKQHWTDLMDFVVVLLLVLVCFDDDIIFCIPMFLNILPCIYTKLCQFFSPLFFIDIFFKLIISIKLAITHWIFLTSCMDGFLVHLYIYTIVVTGSISFLFHWMTPWVFCIVHYSHQYSDGFPLKNS